MNTLNNNLVYPTDNFRDSGRVDKMRCAWVWSMRALYLSRGHWMVEGRVINTLCYGCSHGDGMDKSVSPLAQYQVL